MKNSLYRFLLMASLTLSAGPSAQAACGDQTVAGGADCAHGGSTPGTLFGSGGAFKAVADTLIFIVGAIAVIMLIIGGLRYVISQGDAAAVKQAKDTILYAIIGIVVAILAFAIVSFIAGSIK